MFFNGADVLERTLIVGVLAYVALVFLLLFVSAALSRGAVQWIGPQLGWGPHAISLLANLRWPVLGVLVFTGFSALYYYLPNCRIRYLNSLPGSAIATLGWLGLTRAIGVYVEVFGHYNATYGSFGALMAFLLWLYLVGVIILLGAEVNALLHPSQNSRWSPPASRTRNRVDKAKLQPSVNYREDQEQPTDDDRDPR